ncbi:MAG: homoserine dehydrogenase [Zetaproteobacteria bacterium]|nr:MAG: homoserine dehydrogenase [Zetaproteobacteria bacterium]
MGKAPKPVRIAVLGLGTIGTGTVELLCAHRDAIEARLGRGLELVAAADRNKGRAEVLPEGVRFYTDAAELIAREQADVLVELIGGHEPARTLVLEAIQRGMHIVTANKALIAEHGEAILAAAEQAGRIVRFEAAVGGGIPILKALREGLAANRIEAIYGILNGTCNYILTRMDERGMSFAEALAEAQALGYAEADPSLDVGGVDAAHKLAILAAMAFDARLDFGGVCVEGIEAITPLDMEYARALGYRIKLLAVARPHDEAIEMRVHPALVRSDHPLADVRDSYNAVMVVGDFVERTMFYGRGAGAHPTASAVLADVMEIAQFFDHPEAAPPAMGLPAQARRTRPALPAEDVVSEYYLRIMVEDRPGVIAAITSILGDHRISLEALLQRERHVGGVVPIVMLTHATREGNLRTAVERIAHLDAVEGRPLVLRKLGNEEG